MHKQCVKCQQARIKYAKQKWWVILNTIEFGELNLVFLPLNWPWPKWINHQLSKQNKDNDDIWSLYVAEDSHYMRLKFVKQTEYYNQKMLKLVLVMRGKLKNKLKLINQHCLFVIMLCAWIIGLWPIPDIWKCLGHYNNLYLYTYIICVYIYTHIYRNRQRILGLWIVRPKGRTVLLIGLWASVAFYLVFDIVYMVKTLWALQICFLISLAN